MSDVASTVHNPDVRVLIYRVIREGAATVGEVVTAVSEQLNCPETTVIDQLRALEDSAMLYRDGTGSDAEVRLP